MSPPLKHPPDAERGPAEGPDTDTILVRKVDTPTVPHQLRAEKDERHDVICAALRDQHGDDFIDFIEDTNTVVLRQRQPDPPPIIAVVPVAPRNVFVADPHWYGHADACREPLELVAIAVTADGRAWQVILDNGVPTVLTGDNELAYEHVPEWFERSRQTA